MNCINNYILITGLDAKPVQKDAKKPDIHPEIKKFDSPTLSNIDTLLSGLDLSESIAVIVSRKEPREIDDAFRKYSPIPLNYNNESEAVLECAGNSYKIPRITTGPGEIFYVHESGSRTISLNGEIISLGLIPNALQAEIIPSDHSKASRKNKEPKRKLPPFHGYAGSICPSDPLNSLDRLIDGTIRSFSSIYKKNVVGIFVSGNFLPYDNEVITSGLEAPSASIRKSLFADGYLGMMAVVENGGKLYMNSKLATADSQLIPGIEKCPSISNIKRTLSIYLNKK